MQGNFKCHATCIVIIISVKFSQRWSQLISCPEISKTTIKQSTFALHYEVKNAFEMEMRNLWQRLRDQIFNSSSFKTTASLWARKEVYWLRKPV